MSPENVTGNQRGRKGKAAKSVSYVRIGHTGAIPGRVGQKLALMGPGQRRTLVYEPSSTTRKAPVEYS